MTACPFCQSPFVSFTGLAGPRRTYSCGASTWDSGIADRSLTCHARELSLWKDLAAKLAECVTAACCCAGDFVCHNCKLLTAYNNLKNPTK